MIILETLRPDFFVTIDKRWKFYRKDVESLGVELKIISVKKPDSIIRIIKRAVKRYSK